jgi:MFS family permease
MYKRILNFNSWERLMLGILLSVISPIIPLIAKDLHVGLDYIGTAISLGTVGMLGMSLFLGNLIDILGFKVTIFLGMLISSLGGIGLFLSHSYPVFLISFIVLNSGLGAVDIITLSIVGYFSDDNKLKNILKTSVICSIGSIITPLLASFIVKVQISWQNLYLFLIIPQLVIILVLFSVRIPDNRKENKNLKVIFRNSRIILVKPFFLLFCFSVLLFNAILTTFSTWFTTYFLGLNIGIRISSLFLSLYMLSLLLGMVLKTYLANFYKEKLILVVSILISFVFFIFILFVNIIYIKIGLIFLFGLSIAGAFSIIFSLILEIYSEYANAASSLLFSFGYFGAIIFQFLGGFFSEYYSKNSILYMDAVLLFLLAVSVLGLFHRRNKSYL